ncbi:hypothetical protein PIIN_03327 [Serendipita indica DSM 11827]|uniref:Uncharacterized protein n=1 Tax=Serendipita indica (strain DSM 11827) TaxID=1109443 RepID=G4TDN4_SERID|nr:hypothetical protein PIIN_03327 [Serendipita indica DSM 11827]
MPQFPIHGKSGEMSVPLAATIGVPYGRLQYVQTRTKAKKVEDKGPKRGATSLDTDAEQEFFSRPNKKREVQAGLEPTCKLIFSNKCFTAKATGPKNKCAHEVYERQSTA